MAKDDNKNLFQRLTRLFKSGPVVKRKIKRVDTTIAIADKVKSSGALLFQRSTSPSYSVITANSYNLSERLMRYQDFQEMEYTAEIAAAMDIYADETVAQDDKGRVLHIYSDDEKIRDILEDLFYNILNVEFNLRSWARNLVKYGDFFLYNDVSPTQGVVHAFPIPVNEIEREENYDREDPFAVRYRWSTLGNRTLENWEVTHFRLLGNDMFLPYGSSLIEPARRIWRQLILLEDAMLVYRLVRAPERRVFYIDVANIPPENVPMYVEEQRKNLRTNQVIDRNTGRVDLRYSPLSVEDDYFIAVRGGESGTKIDTLSGGQNAASVEDVQYMQKKLFAALKVPRAYLGYDEMLSSKATLAQEDIRFSRTISVIQKTLISELNKLAIIHLYSNGYDGDELQNFTLRFSNPSTIAQSQKLELWKAKFEIAGALPEGMGSRTFVQKEIWGLNDDQVEEINEQRYEEKSMDLAIESAQAASAPTAGETPPAAGEETAPAAEPAPAGEEGGKEGEGGGEGGGEESIFASDDAGDDADSDAQLLMSGDIDEDEVLPQLDEKDGLPVKPGAHAKRYMYNRKRRRITTHMPDFNKMLDSKNASLSDPFDKSFLNNPFAESKRSVPTTQSPVTLSPSMVSTLKKMSITLGTSQVHKKTDGLLVESQEEIDLNVEE